VSVQQTLQVAVVMVCPQHAWVLCGALGSAALRRQCKCIMCCIAVCCAASPIRLSLVPNLRFAPAAPLLAAGPGLYMLWALHAHTPCTPSLLGQCWLWAASAALCTACRPDMACHWSGLSYCGARFVLMLVFVACFCCLVESRFVYAMSAVLCCAVLCGTCSAAAHIKRTSSA
jgi:hypothetical protein